MRVLRTIAASCALLVAATSASSADTPSSGLDFKKLPWISHVSGACWRSELSKGEMIDRQCFSVQFEKVMRAEQVIETLKDGEIVSTLRADSVYAWDQRAQKVRHVFWADDGSFESASGGAQGDAFVLALDRETDAAGVSSARTIFRKSGADGYCVVREARRGDGWEPLFAFAYERDGRPGEATSARPIKTGPIPPGECAG